MVGPGSEIARFAETMDPNTILYHLDFGADLFYFKKCPFIGGLGRHHSLSYEGSDGSCAQPIASSTC